MNLYWSVYKNLEKELLELAEIIHIDDKQLNVYSVKIAMLLVRTCVEIEAISKELYKANGGEKELDKAFFDSDCIDFLEKKWSITQKEIHIASPYLYLEKEENKILTPLKNANKKGKSDWKNSYQAVKHSRADNLTRGNLKHFIRALGALYILNIYYKGNNELKKNDRDDILTLGSDIFSVIKKRILLTDSDELEAKDICIEKISYGDFRYMEKLIFKDFEDQQTALENSKQYKEYIRKNPNEILDICSIDEILGKINDKALTDRINTQYNSFKKFEDMLIRNDYLILILYKNQQEIYPYIENEEE